MTLKLNAKTNEEATNKDDSTDRAHAGDEGD